ncbi:uncharacterized protein APUU_20935A [Aspergillus puulaauensis]|uniref:Integral membrane protein n=1 Tax=Aspergillus puulaauensis TaxID=1220207 RepID=A0A7R7XFZ9_9EURO|nr:uncharacterized protein APUU_20935A [Aspergillus puulaauensis]BCS20503.1 hypothetical protein APUU_20935A [Aspergillus puulaauensis]
MAATDGSVPTELPSSAPSMVRTIRGIIITVASVALVVCCTRLYIRKYVTRSFGLDDYLVILALVRCLPFLSSASILISTTDNGVVVRNSVFGRHILWNWIPYEYRPG